MPTKYSLKGNTPEINRHLPELIKKRKVLTSYFGKTFYNPDGIKLSLAEWLYLFLDVIPRHLGKSRSAMIGEIQYYALPLSVWKEAIAYTRLRAKIIEANQPIALYCLERCKWKGAMDHDDVLMMAMDELIKSIDAYDCAKAELSTYAIERIKLTLNRDIPRKMHGLTGIRPLQDLFQLAKRYHKALRALGESFTLGEIGVELAGSHHEWNLAKQSMIPPKLVELNEQVIGA